MKAREQLARLPEDVRPVAIEVLDELSRPLTVRDLDQALAGHFTRSQRRPLMRALLSTFDIIAIEPKA